MGELSLENARGAPGALLLLFGLILLVLGAAHISFKGAVVI